MPYQLHLESEGVYCVFTEAFTDEDLRTLRNNMFSLMDIHTTKYQLHTFNDIKSFPVSSNGIRSIAEQDAKFFEINPNIKIAVVANYEIMKGLTNMYKVYFELSSNDVSWPTEFFESEEKARKWLNT